jgi:membrane protein GlpM
MLLVKALIGALIVVLIDFLSRNQKWYMLSALIPLFPTFALIAHILVYAHQGTEGVRNTAIFGILSLIPYFFYLLAIFVLSNKTSFLIAVIGALLGWFFFATIVSYFYFKL